MPETPTDATSSGAQLRLEHVPVQLALPLGRLAEEDGAGHVAVVAVHHATEVDEERVAGAERLIVAAPVRLRR